MRSSRLLEPLLTPIQQGILSATVLEPGRRWYFRELARHLDLAPSSIQRELAAFVSAGILTKARDGNRVYYQAERRCPILPELEQMLLKTSGLAEVIRDALEPLRSRIAVSFLYGSVASSTERAESDVDLMIVGSATLAQAAAVLRPVERRLGRNVNPSVYTAAEFAKKIREKSHFLTRVLQEPLLILHGSRDELARVAERPAGEAAQDAGARASRSARRRGA